MLRGPAYWPFIIAMFAGFLAALPTYTGDKARRLILAKKITGAYHVTDSLDLGDCDLSGVTLPQTIGGWLDLRGCKNPDPGQWWTERNETSMRRCIAIDPTNGYALIQTGTDRFFAGCRKNLTRKQALAHWDRTDDRAKLFTAAIQQSELV